MALVALLSVPALAQISEAPTYVTHWGVSPPPPGGVGAFNEPLAVDVDADGNVYVVDRLNHRIQKFGNDGAFELSWGAHINSGGTFRDPSGIAVDASNGWVYVADRLLNNVQRFDTVGTPDATWPPAGSTYSFVNPAGLDVDTHIVDPITGMKRYDLLVADLGGSRIVRLNSSGGLEGVIGEFGGGPGQFVMGPADVAVDPLTGDVFVGDSSFVGGNLIQKFNSDGLHQVSWDGSSSTTGLFVRPVGIEVDSGGNVLVADLGNNSIKAFDTMGVFQLEWNAAGDPGGQFFNPQDVAVDSSGNIFIADTGNNQVQKFSTGTSGGGAGDPFPMGINLNRVKIWQRGRHKDKFWIHGFLNLDPESEGINLPAPAGEAVASLTIGSGTSAPVTFTMPTDEFRSYFRGRLIRFRGTVEGGAYLRFHLFKRRDKDGAKRYWMVVTGWRGIFGDISSPVTVSIVLGDNAGTVEDQYAWIR